MKKAISMTLVFLMLISSFGINTTSYAEPDTAYTIHKYLALGTIMTYSSKADPYEQKAVINGKEIDLKPGDITPVIHGGNYYTNLPNVEGTLVTIEPYSADNPTRQPQGIIRDLEKQSFQVLTNVYNEYSELDVRRAVHEAEKIMQRSSHRKTKCATVLKATNVRLKVPCHL